MSHAKTSSNPNDFILPDLGEGVHEAELIKWRVAVGQAVNEHDILTGSTLDGGLSVGANCNDWTSSTGANSVRVGHCNRAGGGQFPTSWNSAHTLTSCTEQGVKSGGGRGSFYCFVSN